MMKIYSKKKISILFVLVLLLSAFLPIINANSSFKEHETTQSNDSFSISYIHAQDMYDYGFEVGKTYPYLFKLLDFFSMFSTKNKMSEKTDIKQIKTLKEDYPLFYEELSGLSDSLNIKISRLVDIANFISSFFSEKCTATASTGVATKNNETFLTFNVDTPVDNIKNIVFSCLFHRLMTYKTWVVRIGTMRYQYAFWGIPILYEFTFLNEEGLAWASPGTGFTENHSRSIDEGEGISTSMLERLTMMTCKNVSEAATLWKNMRRANQKDKSFINQYDGSSEVFCDREGGILMIEQTHSHIITVFGNSTEITGSYRNILWHANHHIWLDPNLTGSDFWYEYMQSYYRNKRAQELLEQNYGNITLDVCKMICRDHGDGTNKNKKDSSDICRHPDKNSSVATAFSWITNPKEMTVYWTHRLPCRSRFVKKDFSNIFK